MTGFVVPFPSSGDISAADRRQTEKKNTKIRIALPVLSQLSLKYAYTMDFLIY